MSRRMRWIGCAAHPGVKRKAYRTLVGNYEGKNAWMVDGWLILKWMLKKENGRMWTGFI